MVIHPEPLDILIREFWITIHFWRRWRRPEIQVEVSYLKNPENASQPSVRCGDTQHPTLVAVKLAFRNVKVPRSWHGHQRPTPAGQAFHWTLPSWPSKLTKCHPNPCFCPKSLQHILAIYHQIKFQTSSCQLLAACQGAPNSPPCAEKRVPFGGIRSCSAQSVHRSGPIQHLSNHLPIPHLTASPDFQQVPMPS